MAVKVLLHHGDRPADQVAQVVGQIHVDAGDQALIGEVAVGAEGEGPQHEEPQRVHAVALGQQIGIHHVALGLGHLIAVEVQPAMAEDLLGKRQLHAHQEGGPDDGVEADDLLADDVDVSGPIPGKIGIGIVEIAQGGGVAEQGVHPDVDHMARVEVHGNPPGEGGPGNAEVLQTRLDEVVDHLIDPGGRLQPARGLQQGPDPVRRGIPGQDRHRTSPSIQGTDDIAFHPAVNGGDPQGSCVEGKCGPDGVDRLQRT